MQQGNDMKNKSSVHSNLTNSVRNTIKEKLDDIVNAEIDNAGEITPQTWKIVAHNISKSLKASPAMTSLLQNIWGALYLSVENVMTNIENESMSDSPKAQSVLHRPVTDEVTCHGNGNMVQCEQLAMDTSKHRPLKVRRQALNILLQSVMSEVTANVNWVQIRCNIRENLCEKDNEVFSLSLKVHAKLLQSSSQACIKEGFINLVEGMYLYYVDTSNSSSLPNCKNGIDVSDPIHGHVIQISHLILEAVKEMPKNWLRYGERRVEDIVGVFVNLLAMHTDDSRFNLPKDILFPFHILSVLDPKAKWCTQWLHAAFGQHLFLDTLSQNMALVTFLVEEILSYLETYQNGHPGDMPENIISGCIVKYATFTHTLSVLSQVVCFEKGRQFFPVVTKTTSELVSLEVMLVRMIMFLNSGSNYKSTVCMTPSGFEVILEFVKKLLQIGEEINENLMKTIIEPIKYRSMQPMKCNNIPHHTMEILLHLASSSTRISFVLGSRQKHKLSISKLNRNQNTTNTSAVGMRKTRQMNISLERQFSARSIRIPSIGNTDVSSPAKLIEHITTILMKHQDLSNVDELLSLVEMCGKLFRIHEGLSMLDAMNSQLISAVIVLYKQLSSEIESSRYCSAHGYPLKMKAGNPPHAVCMSLVSFLTEVASTPCGLYALAQEDSVLQDLLTTLFQSSYVPWELPAFRHVVSLITTVWQGASVLAEESYRILARPLCNLWSEFEDPVALMSGSERKQIEATQHFINVIYTFIPNLQGIVALLSEPDSSSEGTLVDTDMAPRTLSELLTFDSTVEPWHYISLLTLRALTTNMDVCLYLNSTIKFQAWMLFFCYIVKLVERLLVYVTQMLWETRPET